MCCLLLFLHCLFGWLAGWLCFCVWVCVCVFVSIALVCFVFELRVSVCFFLCLCVGLHARVALLVCAFFLVCLFLFARSLARLFVCVYWLACLSASLCVSLLVAGFVPCVLGNGSGFALRLARDLAVAFSSDPLRSWQWLSPLVRSGRGSDWLCSVVRSEIGGCRVCSS